MVLTTGFIFDQIEWYRKQSKHFAEKNGGNPVPALAFFHIPLIEYNEIRGDGKLMAMIKKVELPPLTSIPVCLLPSLT